MRSIVRSLEGRVSAHCQQVGINPPHAAIRRFAILRYVEAAWWLAAKLDTERADLLEDLAFRLRLHEPHADTPLCFPDIPGCIASVASPEAYATWPDAPLCISFRDLR